MNGYENQLAEKRAQNSVGRGGVAVVGAVCGGVNFPSSPVPQDRPTMQSVTRTLLEARDVFESNKVMQDEMLGRLRGHYPVSGDVKQEQPQQGDIYALQEFADRFLRLAHLTREGSAELNGML